MTTPTADTPLYNHPLPAIERWLEAKGCKQDSEQRHCWTVEYPDWRAELWLDREELTVRYLKAGSDGRDIQRAFPYSLSRQDIEDAVFSGP
ncbi:MAG: DUF3143 domain-containing protein [Cyanobacteria bacterium]|nr:DUF3143 domain-containing protein [Cyanobacteriota bacterium]MDW8202830.1 DUF3143 domain-containing protein [Cyanobacteriota bacterium SKYGB_h_bin112]